jgi:hypothetical protein
MVGEKIYLDLKDSEGLRGILRVQAYGKKH